MLDNLQGEVKDNFMLAYKVSKFALIAFIYALARRLQGTRVSVNCVEPGPSKTGFGDGMTVSLLARSSLNNKLPQLRSRFELRPDCGSAPDPSVCFRVNLERILYSRAALEAYLYLEIAP